MKKPENRGADLLPPSIAALKERSAEARESILQRYMSDGTTAVKPPYLACGDIVRSHLERSAAENSGAPEPRSVREGWRAYTRAVSEPHAFSGAGGTLSELCVGVMGEVLGARGELQVAAGFFSTTVACVDDYLDKEGTYFELGERLVAISHGYRDLMDMALEEQVSAGAITAEEMRQIKTRLAGVIKTLAGSEAAPDASSYLYEKSCGDKVIGVLFPASGAPESEKKDCAQIGRLVGEAGQLLDDMMDYDSDMEKGGRNYMLDAGAGVDEAAAAVMERLAGARALASGFKGNGQLIWVLDALDDAARIVKDMPAGKGHPAARLLDASPVFGALVPGGGHGDTFLVWF